MFQRKSFLLDAKTWLDSVVKDCMRCSSLINEAACNVFVTPNDKNIAFFVDLCLNHHDTIKYARADTHPQDLDEEPFSNVRDQIMRFFDKKHQRCSNRRKASTSTSNSSLSATSSLSSVMDDRDVYEPFVRSIIQQDLMSQPDSPSSSLRSSPLASPGAAGSSFSYGRKTWLTMS